MSISASRKLMVAGLAATCAVSGAGIIALHHMERRQMYEALEREYDSDEDMEDFEDSLEATEVMRLGAMLLEDEGFESDSTVGSVSDVEEAEGEGGTEEEAGRASTEPANTKKRDREEFWETGTGGAPPPRKKQITESSKAAAARAPLVPSIPFTTSSAPSKDSASSSSTPPKPKRKTARRLELEQAYDKALLHARQQSAELTNTIITALDSLGNSILDTMATLSEDYTANPRMHDALRALCDAITGSIAGRPLADTEALTVAIKRMGDKVADGIHTLADEEEANRRGDAVKFTTEDMEFKVNYKDFEMEEVFDKIYERRGKSRKSVWDRERSKNNPMSNKKL